MAQTSWPFDNQTSTESDWSRITRYLTAAPGGGVIGTPGDTNLKVTGDSTGMNVKVAAGNAFVRGFGYINDAVVTLTIGAANATNPRIDSVVLTLDPTANTIVLAVVAGTAAASPVAPTLTQTDTAVYQLLLGNVAVAANASTIAAGNVTDLRTFAGNDVGIWTTGTRPATPTVGWIGWNTSTGSLEAWNGTAWTAVTPTTFDTSALVSGTLSVARGGTGLGAFSSGFVKSNGTALSGGNGVVAADITSTEQANLVAGKLRAGGTSAGTATTVFVQSTAPTANATGDLWFW